MKDWSFKTGQKNGQIIHYSQIQVLLYNRLMTSRLHVHLLDKIDLTQFLSATYEMSVTKTRSNKRYLEFVWYDLYDEEVKIRVLVDENTELEFQSLHFDLLCSNRQVSNKVFSDPYYKAPKDPYFGIQTYM